MIRCTTNNDNNVLNSNECIS